MKVSRIHSWMLLQGLSPLKTSSCISLHSVRREGWKQKHDITDVEQVRSSEVRAVQRRVVIKRVQRETLIRHTFGQSDHISRLFKQRRVLHAVSSRRAEGPLRGRPGSYFRARSLSSRFFLVDNRKEESKESSVARAATCSRGNYRGWILRKTHNPVRT